MKSSRVNYIVVGAFVLVMLAAFVVVLAILTGRSGAIDRYHIVFDNVMGLKFGSQVLYEGYPVGQVEHIEPVTEDDRLRFRVEIGVAEGWRVPADSVARVTAPGILAAQVVAIAGGESTTYLEEGERIPSEPGGDVLAIMETVADEVTDLSRNRIRPLIERIIAVVDEFSAVLEPAVVDVSENLRKVVADLAEASPGITTDLESFLASLDETGRLVRRLLSEKNMAQIQGVLDNMESSSADFGKLVAELRSTVEELDGLATTVRTLVEDNREGVGASVADMRYVLETVSRRIDAIANNLEGTSRHVLEFSRQIRRNPAVLLQGAQPESRAEEVVGAGERRAR